MNNEYGRFFRAAKESRSPNGAPPRVRETRVEKKVKSSSANVARENEVTAEEYLRKMLKVKSKSRSRRPAPPLLPIVASMVMLSAGLYIYLNPWVMEKVIGKIEIGLFSLGRAEGQDAQAEKAAETKGGATAETSVATKDEPVLAATAQKVFSEEELNYFAKLNERKAELDRREAELNLLEEELHKQKAEIEQRIGKLEQIREEVATVLKDRVEVDQQRVNTLVDFYANMKPKQAAEIFGKLNEDLAVEVLGRMKKKSAADILNLLDPVKARTLSEKFTGYTRR